MGMFRDWFDALPSSGGGEAAKPRRRLSDAELFAPPGGVRHAGPVQPRQPLVPGAGLEVSEVEFSDDELTTIFGRSTQFSDSLMDLKDAPDPWASTQRHDP
jgi:hypothetical protein